MDPAKLKEQLERVFDQTLMYHGFTDYMRDYEMFMHCMGNPRIGIASDHLRYLFKLCVVADVDTALTEDSWARSLDDRLIDFDTGKDLDGFVWGVKWQGLYPGGRIIDQSKRARHWSTALGRDFHEVKFETNAHNVTLVFSELEVTVVEPGLSPFIVPRAD